MLVFLGVPVPVGYERRKIFLPPLLANAIASRDGTSMIRGLLSAFEMSTGERLIEKATFA
jgi:hypothetical protein